MTSKPTFFLCLLCAASALAAQATEPARQKLSDRIKQAVAADFSYDPAAAKSEATFEFGGDVVILPEVFVRGRRRGLIEAVEYAAMRAERAAEARTLFGRPVRPPQPRFYSTKSTVAPLSLGRALSAMRSWSDR